MVDGNGLLGVTPSPDKASRTTLPLSRSHPGGPLARQGTLSCLRVRSGLWRRVRGTSHWQLGVRFARLRGSVVVPLAAACCPLSLSGRGVQPGGHPPTLGSEHGALALHPAGAQHRGWRVWHHDAKHASAPRAGQIMIMTSTSVSAPGTLVNVTVRPAAGPLGRETQ